MACRLRDLTYEICLRSNLQYRKCLNGKAEEWKICEKIKIASLPVMVQSVWCNLFRKKKSEKILDHGECSEDLGGYFIVKGSEKVVVAQERMAFNLIYTFKNK